MGLAGVSRSQPDVSPEPPQSSAAAVPGVGEVLWDDGLRASLEIGTSRTLVPSQTPVSYSRLQLPLPSHSITIKVITLVNKIRRETEVVSGGAIYGFVVAKNPNPIKI